MQTGQVSRHEDPHARHFLGLFISITLASLVVSFVFFIIGPPCYCDYIITHKLMVCQVFPSKFLGRSFSGRRPNGWGPVKRCQSGLCIYLYIMTPPPMLVNGDRTCVVGKSPLL